MTHQGVEYPNPEVSTLTGIQGLFLRLKRSSFHTSLGFMISWFYHPLSHMAECSCSRFSLALADLTVGRENACLTFLTPSTSHVAIFHESHVVV